MTRRSSDDFAAEVDAHLQLEIDRLVAEGLSPADAKAAAIRRFGSPTRAREDFHLRSRWTWLEQFAQDLRYAWRGMRASPAFLLTTVLTLAVALSLLTVVFTTFNAYVLRPFPVADPSTLYRLAWRAPAAVGGAFSKETVDELRSRTDLFDAVVTDDLRFEPFEGRIVVASYVSGNYFGVLRPRLLFGRPLGPADEGRPVAVLGQSMWTRLFGGDRAVLGRSFELDGRPVTIVGVMREEFGGLASLPRDVWLPADPVSDRDVVVIARVRAGIVSDQAAAGLADLMARAVPRAARTGGVRAVLVPSGTAHPLSIETVALLSPVFAAFVLVLVAACVNVSNVMLARAVARQREIAMRLALGASRGRLVRQLLTEGVLLAGLSGACALALAAWLLRVTMVVLFATLPTPLASVLRVVPMPLDVRVFLFAAGAAAATTLLFALLPAIQASGQPLTGALAGRLLGSISGSRLRNALVITQVAVSIVLVVTALVFARGFTKLAALDLGYTTTNVYSITPRGDRPGVVASVAAALRTDPRIASVAVTGGNPLFATHTVAASPEEHRAPTPTLYTFASPEFMPMLRIPITRGRAFGVRDAADGARVAIVSESTARAFWPGEDPIGRTIRFEPPSPGREDGIEGYRQVTVVATVPDVVSGLIFDGTDTGHIYLPADEAAVRTPALLVTPRAASGFRPEALREIVRRLGYESDSVLIVTLDDMRQAQMYPMRAAFWIGALLAAVALVMSISGLYGVLSFILAQRTREIGIRMALGASAAAIVGLMMRQATRMTVAGAAIGVGLSFAALKVLSSLVQMRQVTLLDPVSFAAAVLVVGGATGLAAYAPSRRATHIDPANTLRAEA